MKHLVGHGIWQMVVYASILMFFFSCRDSQSPLEMETDMSLQTMGRNENLTVIAAQKWYERYCTDSPPPALTRSTTHLPFEGNFIPWWTKGNESTRMRYEAAEFPIFVKGRQVMIDRETALKWNPETGDRSIRNSVKLVVLYDRLTKKVRSFIMIFVGSYNYLHRSGTLSLNTYLYRQPDFDGHVLFYDLEGRFLNGWGYTHGEITSSLSPKVEGEYGLESDDDYLSPSTRVKDDGCSDYCFPIWYDGCYENGFVYDDPEFGMGFGVEAGCIPIETASCVTRCDGASGGGGWTGSNPSGGVAGGSSNNENLEDPTIPTNPDEGQEPCNKALSMSIDSKFYGKVDQFYDANLTAIQEDGWMKTKDGVYISPVRKDDGSLNYDPLEMTGKVFVEQYHCHPAATGQGCIPSSSDFTKMAFYYQRGRIDVANYSYGVISGAGCLSIIITSKEKFRIFAGNACNENKKTKEDFDIAWDRYVTNVVLGTPEASVGKLINFLNAMDAGVEVIFRAMSPDNKGNHNREHWSAKEVDANGNYINKNCK